MSWRVKITNRFFPEKTFTSPDFSHLEEADKWLNAQVGKPYLLGIQVVSIEGSKIPRDSSEIIEIIKVEGVERYYKLKSEFDFVLIDLTKDKNWLEEQRQLKIKKALPTTEESVEALLRALDTGDQSTVNELLKKRAEVFSMHPPVEIEDHGK